MKKLSLIPTIYGCCYIVRRKVYFLVGGYDKSFFIYIDDADFSYRLWITQYTILFVPGIKIYHKGSATVSKSPRTLYFLSKNLLLYIFKNLSFPAILITFPVEWLKNFLTGVLKLIKGDRANGIGTNLCNVLFLY